MNPILARWIRGAALAFVLGGVAAPPAAAAVITIINQDSPGEGFNDPTPTVPVGGNPGVTLGEQRLNVFKEAARIWGDLLPSNVPILVEARFDPLDCTATTAVLGSAGPATVARGFPGAELGDTWYHIALANKMAGTDLGPGTSDINATFNSNLGKTGCLDGTFFYYGFNHDEGNFVDLLTVVLHELGHGLGFSTLVDLSTGALFRGSPDAYARHLLDLSNGLHWDAMSDGQRAASAVRTGQVVWDGSGVSSRVPATLQPRREVVVLIPPAIAGARASGAVSFGPVPTTTGVTAPLVLISTSLGTTGCGAVLNSSQIAGKICLIDRGTCSFTFKALAAQAAGAVGVIILNNVPGPAPDLGGTDPSVTIPVASIPQADGNAIVSQLGSLVTATIRSIPASYQGADDNARVLVFTPNPLQPGSSVSHWDVSAFPNLLMEPVINPDLTGVDLTLGAFEDIGWLPHGSPGPTPAGSHPAFVVPNPFTTLARISFTLEQGATLELDIYDLRGRRIRSLPRSFYGSGPQTASWDGTDDSGRPAVAGVYLYRLRAGDHLESHRIVLVR